MTQLTSRQLSEWEAYDKIDPVGSWREDYRMAYISSLLTNIAISTNAPKGTKMTSVEEFMPEWDEKKPKVEQSVEDMKRILMSFVKDKK